MSIASSFQIFQPKIHNFSIFFLTSLLRNLPGNLNRIQRKDEDVFRVLLYFGPFQLFQNVQGRLKGPAGFSVVIGDVMLRTCLAKLPSVSFGATVRSERTPFTKRLSIGFSRARGAWPKLSSRMIGSKTLLIRSFSNPQKGCRYGCRDEKTMFRVLVFCCFPAHDLERF